MAGARLLSFDPIVLVQDVLKRWLVIVLAALAVGVGTYIYTDATYAPVYRTTTTFVVTTRGSSRRCIPTCPPPAILRDCSPNC